MRWIGDHSILKEETKISIGMETAVPQATGVKRIPDCSIQIATKKECSGAIVLNAMRKGCSLMYVTVWKEPPVQLEMILSGCPALKAEILLGED